MASNAYIFLILLCILVFCLPGNGVYAFGAGNIPSFAYMEGRAFRHGDIEDALSELAKQVGGFSLGAMVGHSAKFGDLDIKRVYFGNWLRDYSQAVDVASLKKMQLQTIINLCMALGFLAHGYATAEFEVTEERLGVYLPTEHIDNPKGYPDDARSFNQNLRGPVDPRELDIDPRTGMKNYIANENGSWDTSKALVRRTLDRCIAMGRQFRQSGYKYDGYEAYRLLGQALHTLEDFPAHSNFCELALHTMGHRRVFLHVGDQARITASNGKVIAPLITGTFGSSDFLHSLLGEATDHISQASVSDLNKEMEKAKARSASGGSRGGGSSPLVDTLRDFIVKMPGSGDDEPGSMERDLNEVESIRADPYAGGSRDPETMSPQELHSVLWQVLRFRDRVAKKITHVIENIPGLGKLIDKVQDSISVFVFTALEPFLKPLMRQATSGLQAASGEVINSHDQYEVFNDPRASDPTHSFLSKDHFNLVLNEPAGQLGMVIVKHSVPLIVKAWCDSSIDVRSVTEDILQCLFHPDLYDRRSKIQSEMMGCVQRWVDGLGHKREEILGRLTKESVREHKNIRAEGEGGAASNEYSAAANAGLDAQQNLQGFISGIPVVGQAASYLGTPHDRPGQSPGQGFGGIMGQVANAAFPQPQAQPHPGGHHGGGHHGRRREMEEASSGGYHPSYMPSPEIPSNAGGYPSTTSYQPPTGPPPPFPSTGGYAPSYDRGMSSDSSNFPEAQIPQAAPGGFAPPSRPPPGFPGADSSQYPPPDGPPPGGSGYGGYGGYSDFGEGRW